MAAAQLAVWFAGAAPMIALAYVFAEIALGHPGERRHMVVTPAQLMGGGLWVAACAVSGALIGERRAAGLYLGAGLFGVVIVAGALQREVVSVTTVCAVVGLVVLARARRAVRLDNGVAAARSDV